MLKLLATFLILNGLSLVAAQCGGDDWEYNEELQACYQVKYQFLQNLKTAVDDCRSKGAQLTSIGSEEENEYIQNITRFKARDYSKSTEFNVLLGGKTRNQTGRWMDGSFFNFTTWKPGQPDEMTRSRWRGWIPYISNDPNADYCLRMFVNPLDEEGIPINRTEFAGQWEDAGCDESPLARAWVCKKAPILMEMKDEPEMVETATGMAEMTTVYYDSPEKIYRLPIYGMFHLGQMIDQLASRDSVAKSFYECTRNISQGGCETVFNEDYKTCSSDIDELRCELQKINDQCGKDHEKMIRALLVLWETFMVPARNMTMTQCQREKMKALRELESEFELEWL